MNSELLILFQDEDLLVLNKRGGELVEGAEGCLEEQVQVLFDSRARALHRLDKGTSGALAFSLRRQHHAKFAQLWEKRQVKKLYWALVEGIWKSPPKLLEGSDEDSKPMRTCLKVLRYLKDKTWVELSLETGRRHQARIQCSYAGFPIVGDQKYGAAADSILGDNFALHARSLGFVHPVTQEKILIEADLPQAWQVFSLV